MVGIKGLKFSLSNFLRSSWLSLFHEILEYRLRSLLSPYRKIINSLIEAIEEITYSEKERILEQVMKDFTVWRSLEAERQDSTNHKGKQSESTQNGRK